MLRYSDKGIFGGYNCTFNTRSIFIYRCKTDCEGYFIRKERWLELISMDPDIEAIMKDNIKGDYNTKIKYKVWKVKEKHIQRVRERRDMQQLLIVANKEDIAENRVVHNMFA